MSLHKTVPRLQDLKYAIICTVRVSFKHVDKAGVRPCVPGCAHTGGALRARIFELECASSLKQPRGGALTLKTG